MKKMTHFTLLVLLLSHLLTSCATHEKTGALTGAVVGATVGSHIGKGSGRTAAIFLGAILGSELGRVVGKQMDKRDRQEVANMLTYNKTNQYSTWRNPDTGYSYQAQPTNTYDSPTGPCREFTVDAEIGNETQQLYGTACRQADGSWKINK